MKFCLGRQDLLNFQYEVVPQRRFCCDFDGVRFFTCRILGHFKTKGNLKLFSSDIFLVSQEVKFHTSAACMKLLTKYLSP